MKRCVFCRAINKEIEDYVLWENDKYVLLLDKKPITYGHSLIIPKKHIVSIWNLNNSEISEIFNLSKTFAEIIKDYFSAEKMGMIIKGFEVPHAHIHLVPLRKAGESLDKTINITDLELNDLKRDLKKEFDNFKF